MVSYQQKQQLRIDSPIFSGKSSKVSVFHRISKCFLMRSARSTANSNLRRRAFATARPDVFGQTRADGQLIS